MTVLNDRSVETRKWCVVTIVVVLAVVEVASLNGPNVCMVKQKYNITKRVKYRAPMSIRTYEWCFSMPPRCSKWNTEMRDFTRLETEERTAEVAVCCPGYKMADVSCVPICPNGKTGRGCSEDCPRDKWGPNCVHECPGCDHGACSPVTGQCDCEHGWQGESCTISMPSTPSTTTVMEEILTTAKPTTKLTAQTTIKATEIATITTVTRVVPTTPLTDISSTATATTTTTTPSPTTTLSTLSTTKLTTTVPPVSTTEIYTYTTMTPPWTVKSNDMFEAPKNYAINTNYNRTETPIATSSNAYSQNENKSITQNMTMSTTMKNDMNIFANTTLATSSSTMTVETTSLVKLTIKETAMKTESPKKPETTVKMTTTKSKPKEIWIRPTQRGESTFIETKIKTNFEQSHNRHKISAKNEETSELTTPRTIIVSIIPTSVSYVTFKKIALTTASYNMSQKNYSSLQQPANNRTEKALTKQPTTQQISTSIPFTLRILSTALSKNITSASTTVIPPSLKNITKKNLYTLDETPSNTTELFSASKTTNSMSTVSRASNKKLNSSNILTTFSSTNHQTTQGLKTYGTTPRTSKPTSFHRQTTTRRSTLYETTSTFPMTTSLRSKAVPFATKSIKYNQNEKPRNVSAKMDVVTPKLWNVLAKTTKLMTTNHPQKTNDTKKNATKVSNTSNVITTAGPVEDETFHILTEPEHITAVMSDKGRDHSTIDLISVISIAGGVMIAVITVAIIIVMVERCRKPRYEDVRKMNDMRMQVMVDNNDVPPPYFRSIFHTPLPDPPTSQACHYQPISTLDRNLKQFMRPVVVQTISPIMLENFRGILECHYDHLPQRNYDNGTLSSRCSVTPSMACTEELCGERALSVTDYTIEALKREAKLDVIDNTTSEPLYAEIPCWRPPSEHAIEVLNLNGEAVTEL